MSAPRLAYSSRLIAFPNLAYSTCGGASVVRCARKGLWEPTLAHSSAAASRAPPSCCLELQAGAFCHLATPLRSHPAPTPQKTRRRLTVLSCAICDCTSASSPSSCFIRFCVSPSAARRGREGWGSGGQVAGKTAVPWDAVVHCSCTTALLHCGCSPASRRWPHATSHVPNGYQRSYRRPPQSSGIRLALTLLQLALHLLLGQVHKALAHHVRRHLVV